jgi:hypothetical protein
MRNHANGAGDEFVDQITALVRSGSGPFRKRPADLEADVIRLPDLSWGQDTRRRIKQPEDNGATLEEQAWVSASLNEPDETLREVQI